MRKLAGLTAAVANSKCVSVEELDRWIVCLENAMDAQVVTAADQSAMYAGGTQAVVSTRAFTSHAGELSRLRCLESSSARSGLRLLPDEVRCLRWNDELLEQLRAARKYLEERAPPLGSQVLLLPSPGHNAPLRLYEYCKYCIQYTIQYVLNSYYVFR